MIGGRSGLPDEVEDLIIALHSQTRLQLGLDRPGERRRRDDLASFAYRHNGRLAIPFGRKELRMDDNRVAKIGRTHMYVADTFGALDLRKH